MVLYHPRYFCFGLIFTLKNSIMCLVISPKYFHANILNLLRQFYLEINLKLQHSCQFVLNKGDCISFWWEYYMCYVNMNGQGAHIEHKYTELGTLWNCIISMNLEKHTCTCTYILLYIACNFQCIHAHWLFILFWPYVSKVKIQLVCVFTQLGW